MVKTILLLVIRQVVLPITYQEIGQAYIIFGASSFPAVLNISSLNGTNGFIMNGNIGTGSITNYWDCAGQSVSAAGDINGDGKNDMIIGAPCALDGAGIAYVVYGSSSFPATLSLPSLNGTNGFIINGIKGVTSGGNPDNAGSAVAAGGDINGDGKNDLLIGAPMPNDCTGQVYVIYGTSNFPNYLNLSSLNGTNGFTINGISNNYKNGGCSEGIGSAITGNIDINQDGLKDIITLYSGASLYGINYAGQAYIIYGEKTFPSVFNLSSLNGTNGFIIDGGQNYQIGESIAYVSNINGNNESNIIIGASYYSIEEGCYTYIIYAETLVEQFSPTTITVTSTSTSTTTSTTFTSTSTTSTSTLSTTPTTTSTITPTTSSITPTTSTSILTTALTTIIPTTYSTSTPTVTSTTAKDIGSTSTINDPVSTTAFSTTSETNAAITSTIPTTTNITTFAAVTVSTSSASASSTTQLQTTEQTSTTAVSISTSAITTTIPILSTTSAPILTEADHSSSSSSNGVLIGAIVGGIAVIALVVGYIIYRKTHDTGVVKPIINDNHEAFVPNTMYLPKAVGTGTKPTNWDPRTYEGSDTSWGPDYEMSSLNTADTATKSTNWKPATYYTGGDAGWNSNVYTVRSGDDSQVYSVPGGDASLDPSRYTIQESTPYVANNALSNMYHLAISSLDDNNNYGWGPGESIQSPTTHDNGNTAYDLARSDSDAHYEIADNAYV